MALANTFFIGGIVYGFKSLKLYNRPYPHTRTAYNGNCVWCSFAKCNLEMGFACEKRACTHSLARSLSLFFSPLRSVLGRSGGEFRVDLNLYLIQLPRHTGIEQSSTGSRITAMRLERSRLAADSGGGAFAAHPRSLSAGAVSLCMPDVS